MKISKMTRSRRLRLALLTAVVAGVMTASDLRDAAQASSLGSSVPEHVALTWADDPASSQSVAWRTSPGTSGTVVEYIETAAYAGFPSALAYRTAGTEAIFSSDAGDMLVHEADMSGLKPGTAYTYRVGTGKDGQWSPAYRFTTAGRPEDPFTFLFVSDTQAAPTLSTGNGYGVWGDVLGKALAQEPDARFLLLSGDIVDYGYLQQHWERWFAAAASYLPSLSLVPTMGNHDAMQTGPAYFRAQFRLPPGGPPGDEELAYSLDIGPLHLAVLNSEGNLAAQAAWLRDDMRASDKPWKIVSFHRAPYQSTAGRASPDIRDAWTPIFDEAGVDLVLTGHDHAYLRTWPLYAGEKAAEGEGTTYVIGGTAGPKFYDMGDYPWMRVKFDDNIQLFSAVRVEADTLTFRATTRDGQPVDLFTLVKPAPGQRYRDVTATHWAYDAIERLSAAGMADGVGDGRFRPSKPVTRAELTALLARALHLPASTAAPFADSRADAWYGPAVAAAAKAGLAQGDERGRFHPERTLTREELAALLVRADDWLGGRQRGAAGGADAAMFADRGAASLWALPEIESALRRGLLSGRGGGRFAPNEAATRAEAVQALSNLLDKADQRP